MDRFASGALRQVLYSVLHLSEHASADVDGAGGAAEPEATEAAVGAGGKYTKILMSINV